AQNKNKIFKRISVSNIVEKSKKKERNISGENEEQPIDFEPGVVKKLTNLYNKLQEPNIYPKRKMRDTPIKGSLGNQTLDKLGIDGESSEDESFSEDEFTRPIVK